MYIGTSITTYISKSMPTLPFLHVMLNLFINNLKYLKCHLVNFSFSTYKDILVRYGKVTADEVE